MTTIENDGQRLERVRRFIRGWALEGGTRWTELYALRSLAEAALDEVQFPEWSRMRDIRDAARWWAAVVGVDVAQTRPQALADEIIWLLMTIRGKLT